MAFPGSAKKKKKKKKKEEEINPMVQKESVKVARELPTDNVKVTQNTILM